MIAEWRLPDGPKVIVATPGTMGIGKTLDEADLMIFYSHGYDQENRAQAKERNYSRGQKLPITIKNIVAKGTLDRHIIAVAEKSATRSETIHNPVEFRKWLAEDPE
jgi:SNF2 family DNA or RNA helicase